MRKKRRLTRIASVLMCAFLIVPSFSINLALAAGKEHSVSYKGNKEVAENKINKKVVEKFDKNEMVSFLVRFKEQVDTASVAKQAEEKASLQKLTPAKKEVAKRSTIVNELRATAKEAQANVLSYLEKEKNAKDIKSFYIVNGLSVTATKEVMEKLASFPEVESIKLNETRNVLHTATEEQVLNAVEWGVDRVSAPAAWNLGIDGTGVVVANIDSGVQWNHPALMEKYRGYNADNGEVDHTFSWFDPHGSSVPVDTDGHGTHTMGTMVGADPNGTNEIGVAPGAKWIAARAFGPLGATDAVFMEIGEWMLAPKDAEGNPHPEMAPDIINNSWGSIYAGMDDWYQPMVAAWRAAEIVPVFSAGNVRDTNPGGPGSVSSPGNYPEAIAVGATDINDALASFSLQGPSPTGEMKPEVSAPGVGVRSSIPGSGYAGNSGTSMSAPHVAGAAALLLQADNSLTVDQIEQVLKDTATPRTNTQYPQAPNNGFGHGIINVFDAVSSVVSGLGTIKGQVTVDGNDEEAPVVEHESIGETFAGLPVVVQASVTDNVSVTGVVVEYSKDGSFETVEASRVSGDYKNGVFQATIPGTDVAEGELLYRIKATDFGGNETVSDDYTVTINGVPTVGYFQNFETDMAGWTVVQGEAWERGVPTSGPGAAFSGENVVATNLDGQYTSNAYESLETLPIQIPEVGNSYLQFKQWYNLENNWDFGGVFVTADGGLTWDSLAEYTGTTGGWIDAEFDLSAYAGDTVIFSFDVATDGSVTRDGWYIDDFQISDTQIAAPLTAKPEKEPATTKKGEKVDITKLKQKMNEASKTTDDVETADVAPMALPLDATVTVVETGRSTKTNPATGGYTFSHAVGDYTVVAESYGYAPASQSVTVVDGEEVTANFNLEELPKGTVTGTVVNEQTGNPIEGATIYLMEDAAVTPVTTGADGHYSLTGYEGDYTLKVVAPSYYSQEVTISLEGNVEQNFELKPFIGFPGEIGYDDGTAENARAFYDAGNGWAVKMSLAEGHDKALVTGGLFRTWDASWPVPGGNEFQVAVYAADGADGGPGTKLAGPFNATTLRDGNWTNVDLSEEGIVVEGDFYMVYIQNHANPNTPGLATDEDGEYAGRSYQLVGGAWGPSPEAEGNYMIRATVNYEVTPPTITAPVDGSFTNEAEVNVTGKAAPTTTVLVYNNGEEVGSASATAEGTFSVAITLADGENNITAKASSENGVTDPSETVKVTLDQNAPELAITSPEDGSKTNRETVTVEGTVADANIDKVTVNGQNATVADGSFSKRILLDNGENTIEVIATDKAGNTTTESVVLDVKFGDIDISNIQPAEDVTLRSGENDTVTISFTSEEGLDAGFALRMPLANFSGLNNVTELPLTEVEPGQYEATWTAPVSLSAEGVEIEVIARDAYGNESREIADGKLHINAWKPGDKDRPVKPRPGRPDLPGSFTK
ncbi:S8 family serine peptidase [Fredinandcohnia sp. 179-A 10B2 NHS]|uniref:S8 family serine peptidase n=1 Tax=Fredinandcohnia sp. 179-A 10B2 NHS TaxID=3235176 RepID=UPI0039A25BB8